MSWSEVQAMLLVVGPVAGFFAATLAQWRLTALQATLQERARQSGDREGSYLRALQLVGAFREMLGVPGRQRRAQLSTVLDQSLEVRAELALRADPSVAAVYEDFRALVVELAGQAPGGVAAMLGALDTWGEGVRPRVVEVEARLGVAMRADLATLRDAPRFFKRLRS
jgi:hypothetical protein